MPNWHNQSIFNVMCTLVPLTTALIFTITGQDSLVFSFKDFFFVVHDTRFHGVSLRLITTRGTNNRSFVAKFCLPPFYWCWGLKPGPPDVSMPGKHSTTELPLTLPYNKALKENHSFYGVLFLFSIYYVWEGECSCHGSYVEIRQQLLGV